MSACLHADYDDYFNKCNDCGAVDLLPEDEDEYEAARLADQIDYPRNIGINPDDYPNPALLTAKDVL